MAYTETFQWSDALWDGAHLSSKAPPATALSPHQPRKVNHVTSGPKHFTLTISRETHQRLVALPFARDAMSHAVPNDDGTITFPVPPHIRDALHRLHPDPDMAIQILLGLKTH